jgi:polyferredoxin
VELMLREELSKLKTGERELRKFGLVVGLVFGLLALLFWWRSSNYYPVFIFPAAPLILLGLFRPASLKWVYLGWMSLGLFLGLVVSTVLLTVFYYLVMTPLGLLARLFGKDFLDRRIQKDVQSYWRIREKSGPKRPETYEQQF